MKDSVATQFARLRRTSNDGDVHASRRKRLGQCFTGKPTARLLAALAALPTTRRILDPMAGSGDLLEAVAERALGLGIEVELAGVEIDKETARLGKSRLKDCESRYPVSNSRFVTADGFQARTWTGHSNPVGFDLVITNPPYVRYQSQASQANNGGIAIPDAAQVRDALRETARHLSPHNELYVWDRLIASYSGLADLSVPSWLLCSLLTSPGGVIALVAPKSWLNRDYARLARYCFLRFFEPQFVVEESGQRWFDDVLVSVALIVGRRLPSERAAQPLSQRRYRPPETLFVEIDSRAGNNESHVGHAFPGQLAEDQFVRWLRTPSHESKPGIRVASVSWQAQCDDTVAKCARYKWFDDLESHPGVSTSPIRKASGVPAVVASLIPAGLVKRTQLLSETPIRVGQGLRTGCNAFFYVEVSSEKTPAGYAGVLTSELFGRRHVIVPREVLKPIVRRQVEAVHPQVRAGLLIGRVLDLRGWLLPEDAKRLRIAAATNSTNAELKIMPEELADYVRQASRSYIYRGELRTLIPQLSAVRTNDPGSEVDFGLLPTMSPTKLRAWYMLPDFAPRHLPSLFLPRIVHGQAKPILNSMPPVLVDANFSTLWCDGEAWGPNAVFALLSSTWAQLCMEATGSPMGGGALKLEATHLRDFPLPEMAPRQWTELDRMGADALTAASLGKGTARIARRIDRLILSALAGKMFSDSEADRLVAALSEVVDRLRLKRRRTVAVPGEI